MENTCMAVQTPLTLKVAFTARFVEKKKKTHRELADENKLHTALISEMEHVFRHEY